MICVPGNVDIRNFSIDNSESKIVEAASASFRNMKESNMQNEDTFEELVYIPEAEDYN